MSEPKKCMWNGCCVNDAIVFFQIYKWRYYLCQVHRILMGYDLVATAHPVDEEEVKE